MHNDSLDLGFLVQKAGLLNEEQFDFSDFRNLLGKSLEKTLVHLLDGLGVPADVPLVKGEVSPGAIIEGRVFIAEGAIVEPTAYIIGPAYIGPDSEVRHGAYIRGNVYVGRGCVVGHATEVKGSVFFDGAKAGHFAYVGDSILGREVNLGAGTKLANLKLQKNQVRIRHPESSALLDTGLRKLGALIADNVQIGCNAVLSPGAILQSGALVTPCAHIQGTKGRGIHK